MSYFLGIDAGGTKTLALIADGQGRVLGAARSGTGNWESVGLAGAYTAYADAVADVLRAAGLRREQIVAAGYALAGMDWPSDERRLTPLIERLGLPGRHVLVNDSFAALRAGSPDDVGVAVICGTGSTTAGRNRGGETFRTFGLGALWGEYQGASGLVWAAFRAMGRAYFGSGPATALEAPLLAAYGATSVPALAEQISRGEAEHPDGTLAPLVLQVADTGDPAARAIVQQAGAELGLNAAAVARRLELAEEAFTLVMAGGVCATGNAFLVEALVEPVRAYAPLVRPVVLQAPPAIGSVLLAMDAAGVAVSADVRARMEREAYAAMGNG